jgi:hypothetical protein
MDWCCVVGCLAGVLLDCDTSPVKASLQETDTPLMNQQPASWAESQPVADVIMLRRADSPEVPDCKLRNRIILANVLVWILITFILGILLF